MPALGDARKERVQPHTVWLYAGLLISASGPMSFVALIYLCKRYGDLPNLSKLQEMSVVFLCAGLAILTAFMAKRLFTYMAIIWEWASDLREEPRETQEAQETPLNQEQPVEDSREDKRKDSNPVYSACALPVTAPDSIRVIRLHPGSGTDELQCTLVAVRLGEQPSYEALSYCWSKSRSKRYIRCHSSSPNSQPSESGSQALSTTLDISLTLHNALVYLRYPREERVLWADQICINQNDDTEKSAQVKIMKDIYSSTKCAIVWLRVGRPDPPEFRDPQRTELPEFYQQIRAAMASLYEDDGLKSDPLLGSSHKVRSKRPLRDMSEDERAKHNLPGEFDERWTLFYGFFDSPWFSRVWVIQEVAWPKYVNVHYAGLTTSWDDLTMVMSFLESLDLERLDPKRRAVRHFYSRIKSLQACRKSTQEGALESLDRVLSQHRMVGASHPLDYVYGMMGLALKQTSPPYLTPDYTADPRDVFFQTAEWAVREGGLDILGLCGDPTNPNRPQGLPSWVPDFSDPTGPHSLTGMGMLAPNEVSPLTRFRASKGLPTTAVVRKDSVMEAWGHSIGKIEEMTLCAEPGKDTLEYLKKHTSSQVESSRLHKREINREGLRMLNTKMAWGNMARKLTAKSNSYYAYANESMNVAVMRTFLLGETGVSLERLRPFYKNDQFELKLWRLLTLGQGCSSPVTGYFIVRTMVFGLIRAESLLRWCGYDPSFSASGDYYTRRQLSAERELFCDTKGLIGLAPRWALPGDEIFLLEGGKVPMILRRTGGDGCSYQFIGEAYVHGAMHGKMFDPDKCEKLLIH